ncbi:DnaJ-domain-containing protein 1 [Hydrogenophaga palleronii]|uniref:DnaJ-domain-containing protein 1 n=1 Tax=Hydrogenophaga palleronii TaxID=65655 RepID=A0ABU1WTL8_9BURK|nr:J domain-containing protein [Hydrogenophaga palleronii]MDR7152630.1 DnaJ-domain-containing protein 1 [Hydrogenophaga palleronii]
MFDDLKVSDWWFLGIAAFVGYLTVKHFMDKLPGNSSHNQAGAPAGPEVHHKENSARSVAVASTPGDAPLHWHQVLEVDAGASPEELMQAYERKLQLYHPDKMAGLGPAFMAIAEARTKEIHEAYQQGCAARGGSV